MRAVAIAAAVLALAVSASAQTPSPATSPAPPPAAAAMPEIPLGPVVGGKAAELSWAKLKGKVVLLDFFSLACKPCVAAMPGLVKLQADHAKDLQIVGYHIGRGTPEEVQALVDRMKLDYPVILPPDYLDPKVMIPGQSFLESFGSEMLPATSLIDRDGKLVAWDLKPDAVPARVEELLKRK